ncbi:hypothetical protein K461DRAFT_275998 [Myriangium duriaei CBS 260.36]|uniref:mRNA export factor MEX67 n=1 Tax=Myriangium duriaei CBS 260.36 TaxID=1168546 RepID=A0A9P4J9L9_9PEZI|nr:hypothetical protein K461DRAFT_275998 [Myriangium duriaei CBS 260.36]
MVARNKSVPKGPRGGIQKRRTALRADKDGDLSMDSSAKGRGGIAKRSSTAPPSESSGRKPRGGAASSTRLRAEVMRHVSSGNVAIKGNSRASAPTQSLEDIIITGWTECKTMSGQDSIVPALIAWVEKKATLKSPTKRPVKVKKSRVDDKSLIISILAGDAGAILRLNSFVFAGANLKIERAPKEEANSETTKNTIAMMKSVLERRYNPDLKLLDLSALGQDPDLKASTIFDQSSTTSKFFPALMKVLDRQFETPAQKHEAIQSVTLANNDLPDLSVVTTLSQTVPQLKNLDLSNNKFAKLRDIEVWRRRFSKLDHLVISNNPIEQSELDLVKTLTEWYPRLRLLNSIQVRSDEEAAKGMRVVDLPFPIKTPVFQDEGQIAENFIRTFFTGYDTERTALARMYYDNQSDFSFSVNTGAPRDETTQNPTASQEWDAYIKSSRNLKKLNHLPARQSRLYKGVDAVIQSWTHLPATRHPDLVSDAKKWLIECQLQPGLPDPTNQSPGGVDGFLITIHGEFDEMDVSTGQVKKKRSFDRTLIIGPGGRSGVRVVNDMLTIRAYGGTQAFEPDDTDNTSQAHPSMQAGLPQGLTPELAQQMVLELQKQTNMTAGYAKDCLEQVTWDFDRALQAFAAVRANLPSDAFVQPQAA